VAHQTYDLVALSIAGVEFPVTEESPYLGGPPLLSFAALACIQEDGVVGAPVRWRITFHLKDVSVNLPLAGEIQATSRGGREFSGPVRLANSHLELHPPRLAGRYHGAGKLVGLRPGDLSGW